MQQTPAKAIRRRPTKLIAKVMDAVQWLPRDNKEWLVARDKWKLFVLASTLSPATKLVAMVIADFYINRNPQHQSFNWAWAGQETLAGVSGLSRRTVGTAMDELEQAKLIIIDRGGGRKGDRGRTHRYTLRMAAVNGVLAVDVQNLHNQRANEDVQNLHNSSDFQKVACANGDIQLGNPRPKDGKGLPTTPSNIPLDSPYGVGPQEADALSSRKRASKAKNRLGTTVQSFPSTGGASSTAQADLARFVGRGDAALGWELLMALPEVEVSKLAHRFKAGECVGDALLAEIGRLVSKESHTPALERLCVNDSPA